MVTPVVITGVGLQSALGNFSETWKAILLGQTGLQLRQPFAELPPRPMGLIGNTPLKNLNSLSQSIIRDALMDAQLTPPLQGCGVVVGSSRHHQGRWEALAQTYAQNQVITFPSDQLLSATEPDPLIEWMQFWPGGTAIATARWLQTQAPVLSPMAACATGLWALAQGYELIQLGQCQQVVVATVEAPVTPLALAGFEKAGILARTGVYPFDVDREGLAIAEGGAAFILETLDAAQSRQVTPYGQILGFGLAADAYHMSTPDPQGKGATSALRTCLQHSHLTPSQIDYVHTHGTGTPWNDKTEAHLLNQELPHLRHCSSTKGSTGHTLGASGAIGAALTLKSLQTQILLPNVGLRSPAFDLPIVMHSQSAVFDTCLCFSFGFGGQSAVLALGTTIASPFKLPENTVF